MAPTVTPARPDEFAAAAELVFQGGPNPPLPQRIYRVEHEKLGELDVFLVPIAVDQYQAVFT